MPFQLYEKIVFALLGKKNIENACTYIKIILYLQ